MADNFNVNININDNSKEIREALKKATSQCLYAMGTKAVEGAVTSISGGYTSSNQAVDTGRLRASISFVTANGQFGDSGETSANSQAGDELSGKAPKDSVIVGSNVNYASYVHTGTSRMNGRPFLREGIDQTKLEMQELVKGILEGKY